MKEWTLYFEVKGAWQAILQKCAHNYLCDQMQTENCQVLKHTPLNVLKQRLKRMHYTPEWNILTKVGNIIQQSFSHKVKAEKY